MPRTSGRTFYDLFGKYLAFMQDNDYYDPNILSYHYLPLVEPRYDLSWWSTRCRT